MKTYWITNPDSMTKFIALHSFLAFFLLLDLLWLIAICCTTVVIYEDIWSYFHSGIHLHSVLAHCKQNKCKIKLFIDIIDLFSNDLSGNKILEWYFLTISKYGLRWISNSVEAFCKTMGNVIIEFIFLSLVLIIFVLLLFWIIPFSIIL